MRRIFSTSTPNVSPSTGRTWTPPVGLLLAVVVLAATGDSTPLRAQEEAEPEETTPALAKIEKRTYDFKEAGKQMEYALYVPTGYDPKKKSPLVVALHGYASTPQQIIRYPGLTKLAEQYGHIVVAPMGYNYKGWYGSRGATSKRDKPNNLGELSEKDVMNVLRIVREEFNVDESRIYLMGHSMGGGGTWHLAIKFPHIWAALAPIAPAVYRSPDDLERIKHVPVIVVQGVKDRLVSVKITRRWVQRMKELEMEHVYIEDPKGGHVFIAFENLPKIFEFFSKHRKAENPKG